MATRIPLVIANGQIQQLQAGDTIVVPGAEIITANNGEGSTVAPGAPVYVESDGDFNLARANSVSTADATGLLIASTATGDPGLIATGGTVTLTTGEWDAITGDTGGLTPKAKYYVSPAVAGELTATAPTTTGQVVKPIGEGLSTTVMRVLDRPSVLL
jgi:hypothetical protein